MKKSLLSAIIASVVILSIIAVIWIALTLMDSDETETFLSNDVIPTENEHTEYEGVFMSLRLKGRTESGNITFKVLWLNYTENSVTFGSQYDIQIQNGDSWLSVDAEEQRAWDDTTYTIEGEGHRTVLNYSTEGFDISDAGRYRLVASFNVDGEKKDAWIEFDVFNKEEKLAQLRRDYPEYFGLDSEKGICLYVWQMAELSYKCGLLQGYNEDHTNEEIRNLKAITPDEAIFILDNEYKSALSDETLSVNVCKMPYSSYYYKIDEYYLETVKKIFGYNNVQATHTEYGLSETANGEYKGVKIKSSDKETIPLYGFSSSTSYHNGNWLVADGFGAHMYFEDEKFNTWIPTVRKNGKLELELDDNYSYRHVRVYDLEHNKIHESSTTFDELNDLTRGEYYVRMLISHQGDFIVSEKKYESSGYEYLFGLIVE